MVPSDDRWLMVAVVDRDHFDPGKRYDSDIEELLVFSVNEEL